jgi:hypothetical protein
MKPALSAPYADYCERCCTLVVELWPQLLSETLQKSLRKLLNAEAEGWYGKIQSVQERNVLIQLLEYENSNKLVVKE